VTSCKGCFVRDARFVLPAPRAGNEQVFTIIRPDRRQSAAARPRPRPRRRPHFLLSAFPLSACRRVGVSAAVSSFKDRMSAVEVILGRQPPARRKRLAPRSAWRGKRTQRAKKKVSKRTHTKAPLQAIPTRPKRSDKNLGNPGRPGRPFLLSPRARFGISAFRRLVRRRFTGRWGRACLGTARNRPGPRRRCRPGRLGWDAGLL